MASRYIQSVADDDDFSSKVPALPGVAGLAYQEDDGQINVVTPAGTKLAIPLAIGAGLKIARGQHTTVAAADTVVTGLATVVAVVATPETDVDGDAFAAVTAQIGDQAGSPAAGSIIIKTWKANGASDVTLVAATAFDNVINWIAIGT